MKITNSHSVFPTKAKDRSAKALELVFANPRVSKSEVGQFNPHLFNYEGK